jgi:hypothetical protein
MCMDLPGAKNRSHFGHAAMAVLAGEKRVQRATQICP